MQPAPDTFDRSAPPQRAATADDADMIPVQDRAGAIAGLDDGRFEEGASRHRDEYLAALHEAGLGLLSRMDLDAVLRDIVVRACALLGTPQGYLSLVGPDDAMLRAAIMVGVSPDDVSRPYGRGQGVAGTIWQTAAPLLVNDYQAWPGRLRGGERERAGAVVGVPLITDGEVRGVLGCVHTDPDKRFDRRDVELLARFGQLAAIALDNARAHRALRDELDARVVAERAVRESEERYRLLVDQSPEAILIHCEGRYVSANPAAVHLLGGEHADDIVGHVVDNFVEPEDRALVQERIHLNCEERKPAPRVEVRRRRLDGAVRVTETFGIPTVHAGKPAALVIYRDITAQKRAEEGARRSEQFLRSAIDALSAHIAVLDESGAIVAVNAAWRQFGAENGLSMPDYGLGANYLDACAGAGADDRIAREFLAGIRSVLTGARDRYEMAYPCHSPTEERWFDVRATRFPGDGPTRVVVAHEDITERKGAEEALRAAETRYRSLVEQIPAIVYLADATRGALLYTSPQRETMLGYTPAEWAAESRVWEKVIHPDDLERVRAADAEAIATGGRELVEYRYIAKDGRIVWVRDESWLIGDGDGGPRHWQGVVVDITERKRAEEASRESEERFRAQYQGNPVATYTWRRAGDDWVFVDYNRAADAMTGGQVGTRLGRRASELYRDQPEIRQALAQCDAEQHIIRLALPWTFAGTGERRELIDSFVPVSPDLIVLYAEDITERKRAEEALRESEERFRAAFDHAAVGISQVTPDGKWLHVNQRLCDLVGYTREELVGHTFPEITHPDDLAVDLAQTRRLLAGEMRTFAMEKRYIHKDGTPIWVNITVSLVRTPAGAPDYFVSVIEGIAERKRAEEALRRSEASLAAAQRIAHLGSWEWEIPSGALHWSDEIYRIVDRVPGAITPTIDGFMAAIHPDDRERVVAAVRACVAGTPLALEIRALRPDGTVRVLAARGEVERDAVGVPVRVRGTALDVTERKRAEEELRRHAYDDPLTGLPNRHAFTELLAAAARRADAPPGQMFAVAFLDLDRFKSVNDSLGHHRGDRLLALVAERFRKCAGPGVTVARFGGDEFALLLEGIGDADQVIAVAERVHAALRAPFRLGGLELRTTASVGIAIGGPAAKVGDLLRDADTAMYRAKAGGAGRTAVFDAGMRAAVTRRLTLEAGMQRALERGEFRLAYQPIVALATGAITGFEALVRWEHLHLGLLMPSEFIPVAEEAGLIVPLGAWILSEACRQLGAWRRETPSGEALTVAVNLSARQIAQPGLVEHVERVLAEMDLPPASLHLEITEGVLVADTEAAHATLARLRGLGVGVHLDDFGMEYSSLDYLRRFPIDAIKVDQSFVRGLLASERDRAVVQAIVTLAHSLGLQVTAEGIETFEQKARLEKLGCDRGQGYFFAQPVSADEARALLTPGAIAGEARRAPIVPQTLPTGTIRR